MSKPTRLQFDVTPEALEKLEELKKKAGATTRADLVRNALRLYEWFLSQKSDGNEILVRKGEELVSVEFIFH